MTRSGVGVDSVPAEPTKGEDAAKGETAGGTGGTELAESDRVLSLDSVSHRYGGGGSVLEDISFGARAGEFISIVGPSGCGKSTLLSLIAGLERPFQGTITVAGQPVRGLRKDVGFVFQQDSLLPWKTILANAALGLRYRRVGKREAHERAMVWLTRLGVGHLADRYPHQVSGGQRKRAALAATLVYEPRLVLMDEPFSAVDVITRDFIETDILAGWSQTRDQTFIFVTHDLEEAVAMSQRVVILSAGPGRIRADHEVDLPEPRDVREIRSTEAFRESYAAVWRDLRKEVLIAAEAGHAGDAQTDAQAAGRS